MLAGAEAWVERDGEEEPSTPAFAEHERGQFYLREVIRLVSLAGDRAVFGLIAPDASGNPGFRVRQPGRRDVEVYIDASTGRVVHLRNRTNDPGAGRDPRLEPEGVPLERDRGL